MPPGRRIDAGPAGWNPDKAARSRSAPRGTLSAHGVANEPDTPGGQPVDATTQFSSNPMPRIETIQEMFDQTFQAMDAMDESAPRLVDVMGRNDQLIRQRQAREAAQQALPDGGGPVKLQRARLLHAVPRRVPARKNESAEPDAPSDMG